MIFLKPNQRHNSRDFSIAQGNLIIPNMEIEGDTEEGEDTEEREEEVQEREMRDASFVGN